MGIETERQLELHSPFGEDKLLIRQFHGAEQLGSCFEYVLSLFSEDHDLDPNKALGEHVSIRVRCGGQPERYIDGLCCEFGHTGSRGRFATYRMVLRPWLWLLSTRSDCRIFQKHTTMEIIKMVVDKWGDSEFELTPRISQTLQPREYCVQYAESDLAFVMRLLEDEGLYFFFEHEEKKHRMIIADAKSAHKPAPGFEKLSARKWDGVPASIWGWRSNAAVKSGGVAMRDYDYEKPRADIDVDVSRAKTPQRRDKTAVMYEYPGQYLEVDPGNARAQIRLDELQTHFSTAQATTDAAGITAGSLFTLEHHKRKAENQEYLVTSVTYQADSGAFESGEGGGGSGTSFEVKLLCIPTEQHYRPARKTPWPIVPGAQIATVVGKKEGEVSTDKYARVQVHFPWERARRPDKAADPPDEHCSCFVRVAQTWTGTGWGALFIPRVGQEVVVEFLDGNPDKPLITGCVYNNRNKPPYLPDKPSQSGIKTRSLNGGGVNDYNELRFDDDKGHEEIVVRAQRDMRKTVRHDYIKKVGNDETHTVANKLAVTVDKDEYTIDVKEKAMKVTCHKAPHTTRAQAIIGNAEKEFNYAIEKFPVGWTMDQDIIELQIFTSKISLTKTEIEIKFGEGSVIKLDAMGVSINGGLIKLNS